MRAIVIPVFAALAVALGATSADAKVLTFHATLDGTGAFKATGSKATGHADIRVDTDTETVDMILDVHGFKTDALWDRLKAAPVGPVHMHLYPEHKHDGPASVLAFPFPYGSDYSATADGFRITTKNAPYGVSAATVKSTMTFPDFIKSLEAGDVVLNIHTNTFNDGEIGGEVVPDKG
jgi:hypothetical protein